MKRPRLSTLFVVMAVALLFGCAKQSVTTTGPTSIFGKGSPRPDYQRRIAPIYPSEQTPRLIGLGNFDTPRGYKGESWRHTGLDIAGRPGDAIVAAAPGEACVRREEVNGLVVYLTPRLGPEHGPDRPLVFPAPMRQLGGTYAPGRHRVRIGYAHLRGAFGDVGTCRFVRMGEPLGTIGTSGIATMPHLHFEVLVEEPRRLPGAEGLRGAINPLLIMRRDAGAPLGTITCYRAGMDYRPNPGDAPDTLNLVWPTARC